MKKSYAQILVDDLYAEGDRDYHFFNELLGFVESIYREPFMKNAVRLNKSDSQQLDDAISLARFLINSSDYVGFYMERYGTLDKVFEKADEFESFVRSEFDKDVNYMEKITTEDRYTVGLEKIKAGAKAPLVTPEIEKIFDSGV